MVNVVIVIVTYNALSWINKCLSSCKGYTVVIIDNGSSDTTVNYIIQHFPNVTIIEQNKNLGFGMANNIGMSYALSISAEYVFLLNQDAYLFEGTINSLIDVSKKHPDYGVLSPIHLNGGTTKLDKNFSDYLSYNKNNFFYFDAIKQQFKDIYSVPFINAAGWLLPKKTLETIGGFDPIFFHYGEDDNFCQRVLFHGLKIGIVPNTYINHDREQRESKQIIEFSNQFYKNRELKYKIRYANPNFVNIEENYQNENKKIKMLMLKSLVKLNFKHYKGFLKLKNILRKSYKESKKSRLITSLRNPNYMDC